MSNNMRFKLAAVGLLLCSSAFADVETKLEQARQLIEAKLAESNKPGVVIGITDRQKLRKVIVHGYSDIKTRAPLTPESRFAIGSISKAFTSIALMQLADEGRYDPHAPLQRYLPAFQIRSSYAQITGHDVMSHTSGLPYYLPDTASSRAALFNLQQFEPLYPPGAHWVYSNTGYQLLGYAVEHIDSGKYDQIIQRRVLEPLGMKSTSAIIDDQQRTHMTISYTRWPYDGKYVEAPWFEYLAGDGSIVSTVADMAAYTRFYLNRGQGASQRVVSERSFALLTTPVLEEYGYGVWVKREKGHTVISHGGGIAGFRSHIEAHPEEGFALVFLSNGGMDEELRPWVVALTAAAFSDQPLPPAPPAARDPLQTPLEEYVGHYQLAGEAGAKGALDISLKSGALSLKTSDGAKTLQRIGVDAFRATTESGTSLAYFFARSSDKIEGPVTGVSQGERWYVTKQFANPIVASPNEYSAYVGHFVNNGPEGPIARIFVRNGKLLASFFLEEPFPPMPLVSVGSGTFRAGREDYSSEKAVFDDMLEGRAQRLSIDGVALYRKDTP
jgi:D-alanyl-D-alanine carboxypeptidase